VIGVFLVPVCHGFSYGFRHPEVGIVDAIKSRHSMAAEKNRLADTGKLLIHEFQNCVHKINMELDLAERGLVEETFKYADLISAVDSMNRSLEDLRFRLVGMEESCRGEKSTGDCESGRQSHRPPD
jgi:hypothetical protein